MRRDLTSILDSVMAGIVVCDAEGQVELMNAAASRILLLSPNAALGSSVETLLGPDHALARLARTVLESGRSAAENQCAVERRSRSDQRGEDLAVDISAGPLFDASGQTDGAVVFLRDATLQRDLQRVVVDREQLAAFGQIAAGVAHEVKNPLGGIRGAAEILGSRAADRKTADAAELIVREVDRIATLLDDLMSFTHGEGLRLAPHNIHRVLDDAIELTLHDAEARDVIVTREFDPSIPDVMLDADRIKQVFLNLTRNAAQAMEGRGSLTVVTRMRLDRRLTIETGEAYPTLRIEFRDTGPGIAPEHRDLLTTPFFTTRSDGTGLGLAGSQHWIARHGGLLRFDSPSQGGACVRVDLPLRTAS